MTPIFNPDEEICPHCGYHEEHKVAWWQPGDPLITVIAFWPVEERTHFGYDNRWISRCYFRTACAHAHYNVQLIEDPRQAVLPPGVPVVCLEEPYPIREDMLVREDPEGEVHTTRQVARGEVIDLQAFTHPVNATYILGNTYYQRPSDHFPADHLVGITPGDPEIAAYSPLYGSQVVTMIWWDRKLKSMRHPTGHQDHGLEGFNQG